MRTDYGYFEEKQLGKAYDTRLLRRLAPYLAPYRWLLVVSVALVVLITVIDLSLPLVTKTAIDRYIVPTREASRSDARHRPLLLHPGLSAPAPRKPIPHRARYNGLTRMCLLFAGLIAIGFALNFAQKIIMEYAGHMMMHDLRLALFSHIQELPMAFFARNPVGRLTTRVTNDVQNMHELFTSVMSMIFKDIFLLAGIAAVLLVLNWKLALAAFSVLPAVVYAAFVFSRQVREIFRTLRLKIAEINTRFAETIGGLRVIQLFLQEENNLARFARLNHDVYRAGIRQIHVLGVFLPLIELLGTVMVAILVYYGGSAVLTGAITLGSLVAFLTYVRMFFRPIRDLADKYNILQNAMASAERLFLIMDSGGADGQMPAAGGTQPPSRFIETIDTICFEDVSFAYESSNPVLKHVSLDIRRGQTVALVGPTGSGKTTLVNLVTRFYDATAGRITINGLDIREIPPHMLRSKIAIVTQDPFLFSGTLRDNILQGNPRLTDDQIQHILEAADCRELAEHLPQGLDTHLSREGASISSGERQLISIARAFARNPELIILDEATSYVDSRTENRVQQAMFKLIAGRTALVVAHRLSTASRADLIVVLHRGRIVEAGFFEDLLRARGYYYRMTRVQDCTAPACTTSGE